MERINDSNCRPKLGAIKDQGLTTGNDLSGAVTGKKVDSSKSYLMF